MARIAEAGSLGKAVAKVNRTQPAISLALARLEADLGVKLFDRVSTGVELTVYGKVVYDTTLEIESNLLKMRQAIAYCQDPNNGFLTICKGQTVPSRFVIDCINEIRDRYPGFRARVLVGSYEDHYEALIAGSIDLIVSQLPSNKDDADVKHEILFRDEFALACRADHPLLSLDPVKIEDILNYPWLSGGPLDSVLPGWTEKFVSAGYSPPISSLDTTGTQFVKTALVSDNYLAVLPRQFAAEEVAAGALVYISVKDFDWVQLKGITTRRREPESPALDLLVDVMRRIAQSKSYS